MLYNFVPKKNKSTTPLTDTPSPEVGPVTEHRWATLCTLLESTALLAVGSWQAMIITVNHINHLYITIIFLSILAIYLSICPFIYLYLSTYVFSRSICTSICLRIYESFNIHRNFTPETNPRKQRKPQMSHF